MAAQRPPSSSTWHLGYANLFITRSRESNQPGRSYGAWRSGCPTVVQNCLQQPSLLTRGQPQCAWLILLPQVL